MFKGMNRVYTVKISKKKSFLEKKGTVSVKLTKRVTNVNISWLGKGSKVPPTKLGPPKLTGPPTTLSIPGPPINPHRIFS